MRKPINLEKGLLYNFFIAIIAVFFTWFLGGPKIDIEFKTALVISIMLFVFYLIITTLSVITSIAKQSRISISSLRGGDRRPLTKQSRGRNHFTSHADSMIYSPYKYIRHPIYSTIVFFLNPAIAILLRSWFYLIACLLIYFVWQKLAKDEDIILTKEFGKKYNQYRMNTKLLFPDLYTINKALFFSLYGILIFVMVFVILNYSSLSFRYVKWDKSVLEKIASSFTLENSVKTEKPLETNQYFNTLPVAEEIKYDKPNSIVIEKLGIDAPLVLSQGQTQKELNADLDKGVIIYPGSAMPGEIGNFFATGHSSVYPWNKTIYGQVFAALDKLEVRDRVVVYYDQHKYEYEITKKLVLSPKDLHLFGTNERIITLTTCWPIGTSLKRLVAEGKLVK